ncbi:hypothetical protein KGM_215260 [Danaus plexippus plexippus]|uniref:Uncharacterized protein n=1 Tax=Danaus plexippus plexippus TaxID=278856 RepID=A0A212F871_DANPL|nr:hypothetical protein KGM_215260 [Danaus plexippus plexippus]
MDTVLNPLMAFRAKALCIDRSFFLTHFLSATCPHTPAAYVMIGWITCKYIMPRNYTALKDAIREAKDEEAPYCQNWEESVYLWNRSNALTFRNSRGRFRGNGGGSFGRPQ